MHCSEAKNCVHAIRSKAHLIRNPVYAIISRLFGSHCIVYAYEEEDTQPTTELWYLISKSISAPAMTLTVYLLLGFFVFALVKNWALNTDITTQVSKYSLRQYSSSIWMNTLTPIKGDPSFDPVVWCGWQCEATRNTTAIYHIIGGSTITLYIHTKCTSESSVAGTVRRRKRRLITHIYRWFFHLLIGVGCWVFGCHQLRARCILR